MKLKVGIFDSGIGGFTVLNSLLKKRKDVDARFSLVMILRIYLGVVRRMFCLERLFFFFKISRRMKKYFIVRCVHVPLYSLLRCVRLACLPMMARMNLLGTG